MLRRWMVSVASVLLVPSCVQQTAIERQTQALTSTQTVSERQLGQRRFETKDEQILLMASIGVLQDLGFVLEEASAGSGFVRASKDRDVVETSQVAGQMFFVILAAAAGNRVDPVWERNQKIRVSVSTRPSTDRAATLARVTFQRVIWNTKNQVSRVETIDDSRTYQEFFDKLSQSTFLQAEDI